MSNAMVIDRKLPGLAAALDCSEMQARLRPLQNAQGDLQVQLLKHVPGKRAVLFYRFADGQRLVGKMYRKDRAQQNRSRLWALREVLQGCTRTPQALACWQDLGLVIQEHMPGEPAPHWSQMSGNEASMHRMADGLADLHAAQIDIDRHADLSEHMRRTCHPGLSALREALPHLASQLTEVEARMLARESSTPVDKVLCHGDFGPGQVLLTAEQVSLVDLDGMSHGDAALDVANFMVGLRVHAGIAGAGLAERFYQRYLRRRSIAVLAGLPHYEAFTYLRRAMILLRKRPSGWETQAQKLVDAAQGQL